MDSTNSKEKERDNVEEIVLENIKDIEYRLKMMCEMKKLLIKQLKKDRARLRREKNLLEKIRKISGR